MNPWQQMGTAPKDGTRIDIWAKTWIPASDKFTYRRFADCFWMPGDGMNHKAYWMNLHDGWYLIYWMTVPDGPVLEP